MENVTEIFEFKLKNKVDVFTVFPNDLKSKFEKGRLLTDWFLFLVVAESRLDADLFLSEDLIRIADRDFFVSAILNMLRG